MPTSNYSFSPLSYDGLNLLDGGFHPKWIQDASSSIFSFSCNLLMRTYSTATYGRSGYGEQSHLGRHCVGRFHRRVSGSAAGPKPKR